MDNSKRTSADLLKKLESLTLNEEPRKYIGASSIGHPCLRKIWYELNKPEYKTPFSARQLRIFKMGNKIEQLIIEDIKRTGVQVLLFDNVLSDKTLDYFLGHVDGVLPEYKMVLEIKSAKASCFNQFKRKGLKEWDKMYYSQTQCYMGFTGLDKTFFIVMNKDTAELHSEIIEFDEDLFNILRHKAKSIHDATTIPPRLSNNPSWFQCKMCNFYKHCHLKEGKDE